MPYEKNKSASTSMKPIDIPEISPPNRDLLSPYKYPYTRHGFYGTLTERYELFDLQIL